jgi:molecular chaperone DnaK (HSP70)
MTAEDWDLAVDFGTSNTTAAVLIGGAVRTVVFEQGAASMPSGVLVLGDDYRVGRSAERQWRLAPDAYEPNPKKRLGEPVVQLGRREVPTVDLVGVVLWEVRLRAQLTAGSDRLRRLVLTHPEGWAPSRIAALREAARRGGFRADVLTVPEPIAAVRRYEAEVGSAAPGHSVVVDFGGGTCDVAVLAPPDAATGERRVVASVGDDTLGGTDFDHRLQNWVLRTLTERGEEPLVDRLRSRPGLPARLALLAAVQLAKEDLSDHQSAVVPVVVGDAQTTVQVTRAEFEGVIAADVARVRALVESGMARAGLPPGPPTVVYLTGGAAQTPAVMAAVEQATGVRGAPFDNPKLVVAEGALRWLPPVPAATPMERPAPAWLLLAALALVALLALLGLGGGLVALLADGAAPTTAASTATGAARPTG